MDECDTYGGTQAVQSRTLINDSCKLLEDENLEVKGEIDSIELPLDVVNKIENNCDLVEFTEDTENGADVSDEEIVRGESDEDNVMNKDGYEDCEEDGDDEAEPDVLSSGDNVEASSFSESTADSDTDQSNYLCQICGQDFVNVNILLAHYETHNSEHYSSAVQSSSNSIPTYFGDPVQAKDGRKWPNRFLQMMTNSSLLDSLTQFLPSKVLDEDIEMTEIEVEQNGTDTKDEDEIETELESSTELEPPPPVLLPMIPFESLPPAERLIHSDLFQRRKYTCPHCLREFQRSDHFRQHLVNHQGKSESFECSVCGQKFDVLITLRRHMATHEEFKPYKCSKCPRRFHDPALLKHHESSPCTQAEGKLPTTTENFKRKCPTCSQTFLNEASILEHERRVHGTSQQKLILRCRYTSCLGGTYPTLKELIQHYKDKHGAERLLEGARALSNKSQSLPLPSVTPIQNGLKRTIDEVDAPMTINQPKLLNKRKVKPSSSKSSPTPLAVVAPSAETTVECRLCFQFLSSIPERNVHEDVMHRINDPSTVLICKYSKCRKILGAKNWLARHIGEHRERINRGHEMESEEDLKELSKTMGVENMTEEQKEEELVEGEEKEESGEEDEEDPWDCRLCDERFVDESDRVTHEEELHNITNFQSDFFCKHCHKTVGNFPSLLIHLEKAHKKLFADGAVKNGEAPVTSLKAKPISKPEPDKPSIPGIGNLIFPCRHCEETYTDQQARVTHEHDLHQTRDALDNYYPCKVCQKVMTLRGLRKHLRKIHGLNHFIQVQVKEEVKVTKVIKPPPEIRKPVAIKKLEKVNSTNSCSETKKREGSSNSYWICRLCFEKFDELRQRETHEHSVHFTNCTNTSFVCKYSECKLSFSTFRQLIKHLREHGETAVPKGQPKLPTPSLTQYKQHV